MKDKDKRKMLSNPKPQYKGLRSYLWYVENIPTKQTWAMHEDYYKAVYGNDISE